MDTQQANTTARSLHKPELDTPALEHMQPTSLEVDTPAPALEHMQPTSLEVDTPATEPRTHAAHEPRGRHPCP